MPKNFRSQLFDEDTVRRLDEEIKYDLAYQVGQNLLEARTMLGMTQEEVAKKVKTQQPGIARIESGTYLPSLSLLKRIAEKAFNTYLVAPQFGFMVEVNFAAQTSSKYSVSNLSIEGLEAFNVVIPRTFAQPQMKITA